MHGNEPCGAAAMQRIASSFKEGALEPAKGTVFLIHANPEASSQGRRHSRGGDDLNRLWDFEFTETLRREAWGYEHHRVLELKEVLGELDLFLDLHSARTPTPPFGISNGEASIDDIAKEVGISFLVQSWYGLADKVITGFLKLAGVPALSVECGSHDDPEISDTAHRIAMNFLRVTGVIDDGNESNGTSSTTATKATAPKCEPSTSSKRSPNQATSSASAHHGRASNSSSPAPSSAAIASRRSA
ncbi:MAG: succinylglutamate desuccinylase/aspartoacylase family protein [Deltaproteobacteria bacterium]|nr:succinylglutamate desuccinylase/aspartoacylase family protein [Deltaproteobacteria bacterium]